MHSGKIVWKQYDEDEMVARIVENEILADDNNFEKEITRRIELERRYLGIRKLKGESSGNGLENTARKKALEELLYALLAERQIPEFKANGTYKANDIIKIRSSDNNREYAYGVVLAVNGNRIEVACCDYSLGKYVDREFLLTPESRQITERMQDKRFIIRDRTYRRKESYDVWV